MADPDMTPFIRRNAGYFLGSLCWSLREAFATLDGHAAAFNAQLQQLCRAKGQPAAPPPGIYQLTTLHQDQVDTLLYINDVYDLHQPQVQPRAFFCSASHPPPPRGRGDACLPFSKIWAPPPDGDPPPPQGCIGRGGGGVPPGRPAYAQPLSP